MTTSLVKRLVAVKDRLELQHSQQDLEDRAEKAEIIASRVEEFARQAVAMAETVRRCAKQVAPDRRAALPNWTRVREHFVTLRDQVKSLPDKTEAAFSSQFARSTVGGKRPQSIDTDHR